MHDQSWSNLLEAIDRMTDVEKRDLIDRLKNSLSNNGGAGITSNSHPLPDVVAKQKRAWDQLIEHVATVPRSEPDERIGSRDHDSILYDESCHDGPRENPHRDLH